MTDKRRVTEEHARKALKEFSEIQDRWNAGKSLSEWERSRSTLNQATLSMWLYENPHVLAENPKLCLTEAFEAKRARVLDEFFTKGVCVIAEDLGFMQGALDGLGSKYKSRSQKILLKGMNYYLRNHKGIAEMKESGENVPRET